MVVLHAMHVHQEKFSPQIQMQHRARYAMLGNTPTMVLHALTFHLATSPTTAPMQAQSSDVALLNCAPLDSIVRQIRSNHKIAPMGKQPIRKAAAFAAIVPSVKRA